MSTGPASVRCSEPHSMPASNNHDMIAFLMSDSVALRGSFSSRSLDESK